jgi:hypothetical protein
MDASFTAGIFEEDALVFGIGDRLLHIAVDFSLDASVDCYYSKLRDV